MAAPGLGKCDVSSGQATMVKSIKNSVALGEYSRGSAVAASAIEV